MLAGLEHRLVASSATAKELQGQVARLQSELGGERERREGEGAAAAQRVRERERRVVELEAEVEGERRHVVAAVQEGREGREKVCGGREGQGIGHSSRSISGTLSNQKYWPAALCVLQPGGV